MTAPVHIVAHEVDAWPVPDPDLLAERLAAAWAGRGAAEVVVVLVEAGNLPRAADGSVDAEESRRRWPDLDGIVFEQRFRRQPAAVRSSAEIEAWLVACCRELVDAEGAASIDLDVPLADLGIDSVALAGALGELEAWLGAEVPATVFWRHPTIRTLAVALAEEVAGTHGPRRARPATAGATAPAIVGERAAPDASPSPPADPDAIALVGIGCRFPGAAGPAALWERLIAGESLLQPPGADHPGAGGAAGTARRGAFLEEPLAFDASFFGLHPREVDRMDPQHRLLLEVAWEALEDAGIVPAALAGSRTGVFVGISQNDFQLVGFRHRPTIDAHMLVGTAHSMAANRLSYLFDLQGPSMAIDTACSSSLLAVHLACRSLRAGESSLALAAGVNLLLAPELDVAFERAGMLAPGGRCRTFDADAEGYVRGEGCGVVVLRRLADALAAGDRVYAVVAGSATVQDGRSNGITAPNGRAQSAVLRASLADARTPPRDLGYLEAHGTGTPLGDPVEVEAVTDVLDGARDGIGPCHIGSVKTNLGHLEAAAGIAGLVKTALVLHHRRIPPHLHLGELNPRIDLGTSLNVPRGVVPWPAGATAAGVSSFGFGGANVHVTLRLAPERAPAPPGLDPPVLLVSAKDEGALARRAVSVADRVAGAEPGELTALRTTCNVRVQHHRARVAAIGDDPAGLAEQLRAAPVPPAGPATVAFVFGGQGSLVPAGFAAAVQAWPALRARLEDADARVGPVGGRGLLAWLADAGATLPTDVSQPLLHAVAVGLAGALADVGIRPAAVVGHSVGEVAAATVAGAVEAHDALDFVAARGRAMARRMPVGAMAAALAPWEQVAAIVERAEPGVALAAGNGARCTVVSGDPDAVRRLVSGALADAGVECRLLPTDRAFHSVAVEGALDDIRSAAGAVRWRPSTLVLGSTVDGEMRPPGWTPSPEHWVEEARRPVRFADAVTVLARHGCDTFVEIGFGAPLTPWGRREAPSTTWLPLAGSAGGLRGGLAGLLAHLYRAGVDLDLSSLHPPASTTVAGLPPYPFERRRHWMPEEAQRMDPQEHEEPAPAPGTGAPATPEARSTDGRRPERRGAEVARDGALDAAADALVGELRGFGVGPGAAVGLADAAGPELVVGALALARLGATIVLVGPTLPGGTDPRLRVVVASGPVDGFHGEVVVPGPAPGGGVTTVDAAPLWSCLGEVRTVGDDARRLRPAEIAARCEELDERAATGRHAVRLGGERFGPEEVVELLWALDRRVPVVFESAPPPTPRARPRRLPSLSLAYFGCYPAEPTAGKYQLVLDAARLADRLGFEALWSPERHFDAFGGAFPAPAVLSAALATATGSIDVRAGSVVLPLHHPIRVAEDWALVDNLSGGRTGFAIASGWNDRDKLLAPDPTADPLDLVERNLGLVRRLWAGEAVRMATAGGATHEVRLHPLPVQREIPLWLTILRNPASWARAAALDLHVLTNLMGQSVDALAEAVDRYRSALDDRGVDPASRRVTVLLHTHVGPDDETARLQAAEPLAAYLRSSVDLFAGAAQFPWVREHLASLSDEERAAEIETITALARQRYLEGSALIGGPDLVEDRLLELGAAGVDEVCCLVDFGVAPEHALEGIERLADLRDRMSCTTATATATATATPVLETTGGGAS